MQSNHNQFNPGNKSSNALLFQINLQRYDFLRDKYALICQDYNNALGFMINAAKKKIFVIDGLIKKRALKHIFKIAGKLRKAILTKNNSKLDFNDIFEKDIFKNKSFNDNYIHFFINIQKHNNLNK